jgi:hypothetical protein
MRPTYAHGNRHLIPFQDSFLGWVRSPHQVTAIWKRHASSPKAFQLVLCDELEVPLHVYMLQWDARNEHSQSLVTEARFSSTASYFCMANRSSERHHAMITT